MNAAQTQPLPGNAREDASQVQREHALLGEIEALRAENEHLRRRLQMRPVASPEPDAEWSPDRPQMLPSHRHMLDRADHARLEYEALYEALASVFPTGTFRVDRDGVLTHVDERLCHIFRLDRHEFPGFGWLQRVHPQDLERVRQFWGQAVGLNESSSVEFRLLLPDGQVSHVITRSVPRFDREGHLASHIGFVQDVTHVRKLEADLQLKEELNRQIIASSPDCTKVLNLRGELLQMTAQGCRLVEVDDFEQVRGQDWSSWWPAEGGDMARAALAAAAAGESGRFIAFGQTFKGTPKWWDTVVTPIRDSLGSVSLLLAVSRDITEAYRQQQELAILNAELETRVQTRTAELDRANAELRETLESQRELYDGAPCGYHSLDGNGTIVLINQTEADWLGYAKDELLGRRLFRDFVLPEYREAGWERLEAMKQGEPSPPMELGLRRRDGSEFHVLLISTPILDAQGRFVRTNSTVIDITERRQAQAALAAQSNFVQHTLDNVPVQLAFYDNGLVCRFANASYARWLGFSPEDVIGRHLSELARPQDYASSFERLQAALKGQPQRFEGERVFADGRTFHASIEYTPYRNNGQVQGVYIQLVDITERKSSELQVRATNERLQEALRQAQALYNEAPCGYHSIDASGVYVDINDTELRWLGYRREQVIGKMHARDLLTFGDGEAVYEDRMRRLQSDGFVEPVEYRLRRQDGTAIDVLLSSTAVRDAQGRFLRSNTTVIDITQRKTAERALQDNQRFLQTITDHVPGLIAYIDPMLRFRFANAEHQRVYGIDPKRAVGLHLSECVPPDVWGDIAPRMQRALAGEPQHFESWRRRVDGSPMYVSAAYLPDLVDGRVVGIFVQIIDITERKRVEERISGLNEELERLVRERSAELLESEQRFRLMVDNLREYSMCFLDAEGRITDWTDSAQRLEGHTPTEVLGRSLGVLLSPGHTGQGIEQANQMLRLAASRGQHDFMGWMPRKDGSRYWAHSVLIALRDDDGRLLGFARINRDMTDAKRLDDLLHNINEELENRVSERTEQLLAANKDLESFSYSVSHDLRSPLRHISSFVSLLEEHLEDRLDETGHKYLGTIANSARHMSQLIDGLLAFSRLGRAAMTVAPVDFGQLVAAVVNQLDHDTQGRVVDWVVPDDLPVVPGDALLLREVWANLLGNAFKYTRPRERSRIEVGWSVDPAVGYTFFVRDNGVGFDTKYASKLFGVFQRLHRASEFEGTGIGLALTRRILERHGGSIWAESHPGEGSVFYFSLPFEGLESHELLRDSIPSMLES
ncbi:MAG TPA: PAS domain S-box protein [Hydrogenophaga sp.]|uniref:PAS domain-containing sensor histidine kinase n=3 Tax=Hydrogenophaga sp. TaxID=1904254 RepID=UPI002BA4ED51|nr:PAS domain S-box protein [Hydrogenophaga sp.]HMN92141.1 PAS domain S-box protein [Hydrogenophaga sp.]